MLIQVIKQIVRYNGTLDDVNLMKPVKKYQVTVAKIKEILYTFDKDNGFD